MKEMRNFRSPGCCKTTGLATRDIAKAATKRAIETNERASDSRTIPIYGSPYDEPVLTTDGYIKIGELYPHKHRLAGYMPGCNRLAWGGKNSKHNKKRDGAGYPFVIARNRYQGRLITIKTEQSRASITPTHRLRVKFSDNFFEKWVVYLMRRNNWWRAGICVSGHRPYKSGGITGRLATEQADCAWILKVCQTREEAIIEESIIHGKYGIPGLTFEAAVNRSLNSKQLHIVHNATQKHVNSRIDDLFKDFEMFKHLPLWTRQNNNGGVRKRNMRGSFLTVAANMLNGYMEVLVPSDDFILNQATMTFKKVDNKPIWLPVRMESEEFNGDVYGLEVLSHHYYISGNTIVHDSAKEREADCVFISRHVHAGRY